MKLNLKTRYFIYFLAFLIAVLIRFSGSIVTILDLDSTGYLAPALKYLTVGNFDHVYSRSYPYPLFLLLILSIIKNINAICIVQHVLGLLTGIFLFSIIEYYYKNPPIVLSKNKKNLFFAIGIVFVCSLLFNGNTIQFEKMLRPEGIIFPCFAIFIFLLFLYFNSNKKKLRLVTYGFIVALISIFYLLFPRFGLGFVSIAVLITLHEILKNGKILQRRTVLLLTTSLLLYIIIIIPEFYLVNKYDRISKSFAFKQFFYSNAPIIYQAIQDSNVVNKNYDYNYLKKKIELATIQKKDPKDFPILQYDMDYMQYVLGDNELHMIFLNEISNHLENKIIHKIAAKAQRSKVVSSLEKQCLLLCKSSSLCDSVGMKKLIGVDSILNLKSLVRVTGYIPTREDSLEYKSVPVSRYIAYYKSWFKIITTKYPMAVLEKSLRQILFVLFYPDLKINFLSFAVHNSFSQSFEKDRQSLFNYLKGNLNYIPDEEIVINFPFIFSIAYKAFDVLLRLIFLIAFIHTTIVIIKKPGVNFQLCVYLLTVIPIIVVAILTTFDNQRYIQSLSFAIIPFIYFYLFTLLKRGTLSKLFHLPLVKKISKFLSTHK